MKRNRSDLRFHVFNMGKDYFERYEQEEMRKTQSRKEIIFEILGGILGGIIFLLFLIFGLLI